MITGLITRVIFVTPSWDTNITEKFSKVVLDMGLLSINNSNTPTYVGCMYMPLQERKQCMYVKPSRAASNDDDGIDFAVVDLNEVGEFKVRHWLLYFCLG